MLRRERGLTQQELAALCNFPGPWKISRLEGGKKGSGIERLDTLEVVCQELGIELWELLKPDFEIPGEKPDDADEENKNENRTEGKPPCGYLMT